MTLNNMTKTHMHNKRETAESKKNYETCNDQ